MTYSGNYFKTRGYEEMKIEYDQLETGSNLILMMNFMTLALSDTAPVLLNHLLPQKVGADLRTLAARIKNNSSVPKSDIDALIGQTIINSCGSRTNKMFIQRSLETETSHLLNENRELIRHREGYFTDVLINATRLYFNDWNDRTMEISRFKAHAASSHDRSFSFLSQIPQQLLKMTNLYDQTKFRISCDLEINFINERKAIHILIITYSWNRCLGFEKRVVQLFLYAIG